MERNRQQVLGAGAEEQYTPPDFDDDEYDAMNFETFGGDVEEEWEFEQFAEQTLQQFSDPDADQHVLHFSRCDREMNVEEMLEESVSHLIDDDDTPGIGIPNRRHLDSVGQIDACSPQSPFLQSTFDNFWTPMNNTIWGDCQERRTPLVPPNSLANSVNVTPTRPEHQATFDVLSMMAHLAQSVQSSGMNGTPQPLNSLLEMMRLKESEAETSLKSQLKGAKTLEELEAEIRAGKSSASCDSVERQQIIKSEAPSCEEIEKGLLAGKSSTLPLPPMMFPPGIPPPGFPPHMRGVMPPVPPIPAVLMANPHFRAALLSELAKRHAQFGPNGPFPSASPAGTSAAQGTPTMTPPLPPMPPGFPGMVPPMMRFPFRPDAAQLNALRQQNAYLPGERGMQRSSNPRMRRLFATPGGSGNTQQHRHRDPYSGLMSRREREWLIKIQMMQVATPNPHVEDYYYTMFRSRQTTANGNQHKSVKASASVADDSECSTAHVYVPPTFAGSLGKVQYLSATSPRQLIDVATHSSTVNGTAGTTNGQESPTVLRQSPPTTCNKTFKAAKQLLMEIEHLYNIILELEDLDRQLTTVPEKAKEKSEKWQQLCRRLDSERLVPILTVRKGRRLVSRVMTASDKDESWAILKNIVTHLLVITKRDTGAELYVSMSQPVYSIFETLSAEQLRVLTDLLPVDSIDFLSKSKFAFAVWCLLICKGSLMSSAVSGSTGSQWHEKVLSWACKVDKGHLMKKIVEILDDKGRLQLLSYLRTIPTLDPNLLRNFISLCAPKQSVPPPLMEQTA